MSCENQGSLITSSVIFSVSLSLYIACISWLQLPKKCIHYNNPTLLKKKTTWTSLSRSVYIGSGFCALLSKVKFDRFQRQSNFIERICWYCRLNRLRARSKKDPLVFERWEKVKFLIIRRQIKLAYYDTENCNFQNVD